MVTIGELSRRFSISRSTLLYYDSIGLLRPSGRSDANYRLYSEADVLRMEKIALYREAGLPLETIARIVEQEGHEVYTALEKNLFTLNKKIQQLRAQQQVIIRLLESGEANRQARVLNKAQWVSLLRATGLSEADMCNWHAEFEKMSPEAHQDFLESLGISAGEIAEIRRQSQQ